MQITWINQGGFVFEQAGQRLAVDPYLSNAVEMHYNFKRLQSPYVMIEDLHPDVVFCSHNYIDHLDPVAIPLIAHKYAACRFLGPVSAVSAFISMGIAVKRLIAMEPGHMAEAAGFQLIATAAYHSDPHAVGLIIRPDRGTVSKR